MHEVSTQDAVESLVHVLRLMKADNRKVPSGGTHDGIAWSRLFYSIQLLVPRCVYHVISNHGVTSLHDGDEFISFISIM